MACNTSKDKIRLKITDAEAQELVPEAKIDKDVWSFTTASNYTYDSNFVELTSGKVELKEVDLSHSKSDFSVGTHAGSSYSTSSLSLRLGDDNCSLGLKCNNLNSSEIPQSNDLIMYHDMEDAGPWNGTVGELIDKAGNGCDVYSYHTGAGNHVDVSSESKVGGQSADFHDSSFKGNCTELTTLTNEVTISMWVNLNISLSTGENYPTFVGNYDHGASTGILLGSHKPSSSIIFRVYHGTGFYEANFDYNELSVGTWAQLVATYDGANLKLYMNGVLKDTQVGTLNISSSAAPFDIGSSSNMLTDDVGVWSKRLSEVEVQQLYEYQNKNMTELSSSWTPQWSNLAGYWKMDGNWQDSSGNGNHATAVGDATITANSKIGSGAGSFDGTGDSFSTNSTVDLSGTQAISLGFWLKWDETNTSSDQIIAELSSNSNERLDSFLINMNAPSTGLLSASINEGGGSTYNSINFPRGTDGSWHYYMIVIDKTQSTALEVIPYIDGKKVSFSTLYSYDSSGSFGNQVLYFMSRNNSAFHAAGELDDFAVWSSALNDSEAYLVYNRQKQKYAGHYESPIINMGIPTVPTKMDWLTDLPFMKELPKTSESSADYSALVGSTGNTTDNDLMNGLVGLWHLNESSWGSVANEVKDSSVNNFHGQAYSGAQTAEGKLSLAGYFDGADDYISFGDILDLPVSDFTFGTWIKPASYPAADTRGNIISKTSHISGRYRLDIAPDGTVQFF